MALILLKQTFTVTLPSGRDNYHQYFFNTDTLLVQETDSRALGLEEYEMADDQLIYSSGGDDYMYDGDGGFYIAGTPPVATWPLALSANPPAGGNAVDLTDTAPYEAGETISISAVANPGYSFVNWSRNGAPISNSPILNFSLPVYGAALVANFQETPAPPAPEPLQDSFYDLELRVKGIQVPIPPFVQKRIEGMLSDSLEGEYSYPVNIPLSPKEMTALGLPNDAQSNEDFTEPIPAEVWSQGNLRYKGFLDILQSDEGKIRCSFILDSGFFISQNQKLTLPECYADEEPIDISGQPVIAIGGFEIRFNYTDIRISVNDSTRNFFKAEFEDHILMLEAVADWLEGLGLGLKVLIEYSEDLADETSKIIYWDTTTVTDCEILVFIRSSWTTSRYSRARYLTSKRFDMTSWNNVDESNRIAFPSVYNRNLYDGINSMHDGVVNRYDEQGRLYFSNIKYLTYNESFRWENCIVPYLYLTDVVKTIFKFLKIQVSGEFFDHDLVKRMLIYNNRTLDFVSVRVNGAPSRRTTSNISYGDENPDQESYWYENTHDLIIKLANHAPDYSVVEFMKGLKNFFGLKYDFNILQNRVEIRFVRSKIRSREVLDLTRQAERVFILSHGKKKGFAFSYQDPDPLMQDGALPETTQVSYTDPEGAISIVENFNVQNYLALDGLDAELFQVAFVQSLRAWFKLTPDQDNPPYWKLFAFKQQSDIIRDESKESRQSWNLSLYSLVDSWINGRKMPGIECTANQPETNLENKETGLRIFAFYGQQEDAAGGLYSFASCTRFDAKEILSEDQYDLDIRSEDMYPFHADQERIITNSKEYETVLILDNYNLLQLSKSPLIRIANLDYILEEIEVQNSPLEYAKAKAKLFKIK
ncbi:hypothetical protein PBT90_16810 [Algoriphagus halophytocola]|uniref:InlB B-repeat-containing protein n=1 Tax=Algoriphagus halophytocola TaxID=2991499 RepID=UPI0022DD09F4|nr:hypothetical protein [Algoriphagus sp. TR-M9]WBL42399.1 hypothetical protein PBT90_16810 [Algoriphagus sp. TR-M9]